MATDTMNNDDELSSFSEIDFSSFEIQGFSGNISDVNLFEIVQFFCLTNKNKVLEIYFQGKIGRLYIDAGEITHAVTDSNLGEDAVYECLCWDGGTFREIEWSQCETRTIFISTIHLLLEAARRKDEKSSINEVNSKKNQDFLMQKLEGKPGPKTVGPPSKKESLIAEIGNVTGICGAILTGRLKKENEKIVTIASIGSGVYKLRVLIQNFSHLSDELTGATQLKDLRGIDIRSTEGLHIIILFIKKIMLCASINDSVPFEIVKGKLINILKKYKKKR